MAVLRGFCDKQQRECAIAFLFDYFFFSYLSLLLICYIDMFASSFYPDFSI